MRESGNVKHLQTECDEYGSPLGARASAQGILIEENLRVRMRDGVELATDVCRPDSCGPVLIQRPPHNKELGFLSGFDINRAVQAEYAVVAQDTRGRFASDGDFNPFFDEAGDGADTIDWAAGQPWSTGRVGMVGGSYPGAAQWLAARSTGALQAIAPGVTAADYYRVIYCAAERAGAFGETIARFRPSMELLAGLEEIEDEEALDPDLEGGIVPEEWRLSRCVGSTRLAPDLLLRTASAPACW